jgi:hypothetical protein
MLLYFNALCFNAIESFQLLNEGSIMFGSVTIDTSLDNGSADFEELDPPNDHDNEHDKVEQSELEDYEEHVH